MHVWELIGVKVCSRLSVLRHVTSSAAHVQGAQHQHDYFGMST